MEIVPQVGGSYSDSLKAASWAEREGLAAYARDDHYMVHWASGERVGMYDTFSIMAALARETDRIELVTLVSPITFRHPAVIAKQAVTIDQMSGGRFTLGLGTGWMEEEHALLGIDYPPWEERWQRLSEALQYLRAAFGKSPPGFTGRYYSLQEAEIDPVPIGDLRLLVGGFGPRRSPRLAGQFADEYNVALLFPMDDIEARIRLARESAEASGRDPADLRISALGTAIVASDTATYRRRLDEGARSRRMDVGALEQRYRDCLLPHGTPGQIAEQMARLAEAGVARFYLVHVGPWDEALAGEAVELLST